MIALVDGAPFGSGHPLSRHRRAGAIACAVVLIGALPRLWRE